MKRLLVIVAALALAGCNLLGFATDAEKAKLTDPAATPEDYEKTAQAIEERTTADINAATAPFIPAPFQPLAAVLTPLLVGLAFKRSREHLTTAAKKTVTLDVPGAVAALARAAGLLHTTEDPERLAATAEMLRAKAEAKAKVPTA